MRWDAVLLAVKTAVDADSILTAIFPTRRLAATDQDHAVPSLEWHLIADSQTELYEPVILQFDLFLLDLEDLITAERALRNIFDQDEPVSIGGVYTWAEFTEGSTLEVPDESNYFGKGLRFRFMPIRENLRCGRSP